MIDLRVLNGFVFYNQKFELLNLYISDGKIIEISSEVKNARETVDAANLLVIPGIIDPHTHFALDTGNFVSSDDFYSGSISAAFGGVTTFIDFLDPASTKRELEEAYKKRLKQAENSVVDYLFHATLKNPLGHVEEIVTLVQELQLPSIKIFTTYSDSNRRTYEPEIKELLLATKDTNITLHAHIEDDDFIQLNEKFTYKDLPHSRPYASEVHKVLELAELVKQTNSKLYMVHCSSGLSVKALQSEYQELLHNQFYIESCPQYFMFNQKELKKDHGKLFTFAPPLRTKKEQQLLIDSIDHIDTIGTDHCPFLEKEKDQYYLKDMPLGVGGVEHSFPIMFTLFGETILPKMTENVAKIHNIYPQKGVLQVGSDADFFTYKLKNTTINENHSACDYSIYKDLEVNGLVESTYVGGKAVILNRVFQEHKGQLLRGVTNESN